MTATQALLIGWASGACVTLGVVGILYILKPKR